MNIPASALRRLGPGLILAALLLTLPLQALEEFSYDLRLVRALIRIEMLDYAARQLELMQIRYPAQKEVLLLEQGRRAGLRVCFNPAPFGEEVRSFPLENVDILIVNRTEGEGLSGENEPGRILAALGSRLPRSRIILTLGANGGLCAEQGQTLSVPAHPAKAVDTTAAGDTFIGYYLAGLIRGEPTRKSIETACRAAALCVSRPGAMDSIPEAREL